MRLQERLLHIKDYIPEGSVVADIGTDHGLLPAYLVRQGICSKVIATDLHPGPLSAARSTIALFSLGKKVEFRQGDGLAVISPGEVDVIVIAGMGGLKISDMLNRGQDVLQQAGRLILQPLGAAAQVRRWLLSNGWHLADEDLVLEDGYFYEIIVAEPNAPGAETVRDRQEPEAADGAGSGDFEVYLPAAMKHRESELKSGASRADNTDFYMEIGPRLLEKRHSLLIPYLTKQIKEMESVLVALRRAQTPSARQRKKEWVGKIAYFKGILQEVSGQSIKRSQ